jgi:hypothetical protein
MDTENKQEIEYHWAIKAFQHSMVYSKLVTGIKSSKIKLTAIDEELYHAFRRVFPSLNIQLINEDEFTSQKSVWRDLIDEFKDRVKDYNYGTLLRLDCQQLYSETNSFFATRIQFLFVEIARLREGLNDGLFGLKLEEEEEEEDQIQLKELETQIIEHLK